MESGGGVNAPYLDYFTYIWPMTNILISLVGDQTAPNVFLIKDAAFQHIDRYLFVTTPRMEAKGKLQQLLAATKIAKEAYQKIIASADSILDIHQKLDALELEQAGRRYALNLTGGTKVMSIALFAYFSRPSFHTEIYYLPVGKNSYQQIFPFPATAEKKLSYQSDLITYLTSYGFAVKESGDLHSPVYPKDITAKTLDVFLRSEDAFRKMANELRRIYNARRKMDRELLIQMEEIGGETASFIQTLGLPLRSPDRLYAEEIAYLIGGWLEEWAYAGIQSYFSLSEAEIGVGVKTQEERSENSNEFDLLFIKNNTLHVLECKSGLGNRREIWPLYKSAVFRLVALRQKFGMNVHAGFLTLSDKLRDRKGRKKKKFVKRGTVPNIIERLINMIDLRL